MEKNKIENLHLLQDFNLLIFNTFSNFDDFFEKIIDKLIKFSNADYAFIIHYENDSYNIKYKIGIEKNKLKELIDFLKNDFKSAFNIENSFFIEKEILDINNKKVNELTKNILIPLSIVKELDMDEDNVIITKHTRYLIFLGDVSKNVLSRYEEEFIKTISLQISYNLYKIRLFNELSRKIRLKEILIEISNNIEKVFNLKDVFDIIMKHMTDEFCIIRGMLVLFNKNDPNKLSVFTAFNLTDQEISRGVYKVGEGVIGRVVEHGKPISILDINKDKYFLNRMQIRRDKKTPISFIAVPIKISGIVCGVIAIEKMFDSIEVLKDEEDLVFLISRLIENKVKIYQKMSEERSILLEENIMLKKELYKNYGINNIIGKNKRMAKVFELINMVADSNSSILITGESGTGKELVAKAIHFNSNRKHNPFISVNCRAIPDNLLEQELFGYNKETFSWTGKEKKGKLLLADNGTLFLDEIGEIPLYIQAKLLKTIQDREFEPLGSDIKEKINIRIISATNRDPKELIKTGKLREDLFYKLNVIEIEIPTLKERKDDIPLLVQYFIEKHSKINNRDVNKISQEALKILQNYHWPGNVRELENIIERAIILSSGNTIEVHNLPSFIIAAGEYQTDELYIEKWIDNFLSTKNYDGNVYNDFMSITEKDLIIKSLLMHNRNKLKTSKFLGINRNTLRSKMKQYDIVM